MTDRTLPAWKRALDAKRAEQAERATAHAAERRARANRTTAHPARATAPAKPSTRELWRKAWAKINAERAAGLIE